MTNTQRRDRGFTLIELLLVMVILVVLSSISVNMWVKHRIQADHTKAKADISNLQTALDTFQLNCGRFPTNDEGLNALTQDPGLPGWLGPYVRLVPQDPWGLQYVYQAPGTHFPDSYDLHSQGPDKLEGNEDDVVNWKI